MTAQVPLKRQQPQCPDHKVLLFACRTCNNAFVCQTCATTIHKGHEYDSIQTYIENESAIISDTLERAEKHVQECEKELEVVKKRKSENENTSQNTALKIQQRGEWLKQRIDERVAEQLEICSTIEFRNYDVLDEFETFLKSFKKKTIDLVSKCREKDIEPGKVRRALRRLPNVQEHCQFMEASFREIKNVRSETETATFVASVSRGDDINTIEKLLGFFKTEDMDFSKRKAEFSGSSFGLDTTVSAIQCVDDSMGWFIDEGSDVKLVTTSGEQVHSVELEDYGVYDVTLTQAEPKLMYLSCEDKSIQSVSVDSSDDEPISLCSTEGEPTGLCMTKDDNIAVIESIDNGGGILKVYNRQGNIVREKRNGDVGKLFSRPTKVRCNPVTGDLAVINSNPDHLVFFDKDLDFRFFLHHGRRTSSPPGPEGEEHSTSFIERIEPQNIAFDHIGNLLVSDFNQKMLILFDVNGYFLGTLLRDPNPITALEVSEDGDALWVGYNNGTVKIFNYSP